MGVQPRVVAESCDINEHAQANRVRQDFDSDWRLRPANPWSGSLRVDLAAILRPNLSECDPNLRALLPAGQLLSGLPHVFTGPLALRLQGLPCSVPFVEALVTGQPADERSEVWRHFAARLTRVKAQIWSPHAGHYKDMATDTEVREIAELTGDQLSFRTSETATELRVQVTADPSPARVIWRRGETELPLLAIGEFDTSASPTFAAAIRHLALRA